MPTAFAAGRGLVILQVQGYGSVHGQLQNAIIRNNDTIAMSMIVNDQIQTSQGSFPVDATGLWVGVRSGSYLSGGISNIAGKVRICIFTSCNDANFIGQGNWTGVLSSSATGNGNFTGRIVFTNSPYPQIPRGQNVPIYGSWTADFAYPVPEYSWANTLWLACFITVALLAIYRKGRELDN